MTDQPTARKISRKNCKLVTLAQRGLLLAHFLRDGLLRHALQDRKS